MSDTTSVVSRPEQDISRRRAAPLRLAAALYRRWMQFGRLLSCVTNPVVTAVLYYGILTPAGLLLRAFGRDPLRRARDPAAATYWISREQPPGSMANQF